MIDFAGGTAVHINAGAAALALALVLGKRVGFAKGAHVPHNPPFVLLGAGLLWFGWFGFNAGSELAADGTAALAFVNTIAAPAAALLAWLVVEKIRDGKPTSVGAASGAVAGLVAITPACALAHARSGPSCSASSPVSSAPSRSTSSTSSASTTRSTWWASTSSAASSARCTWASSPTAPASSTAAVATQLLVQAIAAFSVLVYSFVLAFVIGFVIEKTIGFRVKNEDEIAGVDLVVHGEEGYVLADAKA